MIRNYFFIPLLFLLVTCNKTEKENIWPTVEILNPADSAWIRLGDTVVIEVSASDADGRIEKVELNRDHIFLKSFTEQPYVYEWEVKDIKGGFHFLEAEVTDNSGQKMLAVSWVNIDMISTNETGTFTDARDDREYGWVKIGEQTWMSENLKYLPLVLPENPPVETLYGYGDDNMWVNGYDGTNIEEAMATDNFKKYGCLYAFHTAQEVCPGGWHLPSDEEWQELEKELGMPVSELNTFVYRGEEENTGGMLKQSRLEYWHHPNIGASNESGFSALPGGTYDYHEGFTSPGLNAGFWTASTDTTLGAKYAVGRDLSYTATNVFRPLTSEYYRAYAVRCVKD